MADEHVFHRRRDRLQRVDLDAGAVESSPDPRHRRGVVVDRDVQPAAEHRDIHNSRPTFERASSRRTDPTVSSISRCPCAAVTASAPPAIPSAITLPPYISAMRWQYSASSM